jgi:type IV pilus assembly protein PilN
MVRINLLPVRVSKKKEAGKQQLMLIAVLLVGGVLGNWMWASSRASDLTERQGRVNKTRADIAQLDRIIGEVRSLKDEQKALQEKLDILEKLKQGRTGPVKMLDELATVIPKRLWLRKLTEKDGKVSFEGTASTIDDVSALMAALKGATYFGGVELKRTDARVQGGFRVVDFTIDATARYAADAVAAPAGGS